MPRTSCNRDLRLNSGLPKHRSGIFLDVFGYVGAPNVVLVGLNNIAVARILIP